MIDNCIGPRGSKLSVGTCVDALLINILTDRKALYKVMEFYETMDTELLFGEGVTPRTDEHVLRLYKGQAEVEGRFRYLKSPYHVGPVLLQRPNRVKAFGYLMLLSLLLYSVCEFVLR